MRTSTFCFAYDLVDEGMDAVFDNVQERAGLDGISMAAAYHHGRDIFPHSPVRKVRFLEGGTIFFRPEPARYGVLRPTLSSLVDDADVLADAVAAAGRRGMDVHAWTVYFHNTGLGTKYPQYTAHNAFGDPHLSDLCPSRPEVQEFARGLTTDIAEHGVRSIIAESAHFGLFVHGHHHERYFIDLGAVAKYLMGICFCEHCMAAAESAGADAERVRSFVASSLEEIFAGGPPLDAPELDEAEIRGLADGEVGRYLDARTATVTALTAELASLAAAGGARFEFIDPSGAMKGYATGRPEGPAAPESAWMFGTDIAGVGRVADVMAVGYAADPERVRFDTAAYHHLLGDATRLTVAMRPMVPDCDSVDNLAEKLAHVRAVGADRVDFYHYGFMPLRVLDRIRGAVQAT